MTSQAAAKRPARAGAGRPRGEDAERKKFALLEAALVEFADCGFNGASQRVIAQKAGVSTRTLFNRYPTKADLFAGCIDYVSQRFAAVVAIRRPNLADTLIEYGMAMQQNLSTDLSRQIAILIYRESAVFDEVRKIARLQFETYQVAPVIQILRDFGYDSDDLREIAIQFVAMAFGKWQRQLLFGGPPITPEVASAHLQVVTRIFLNGIGAPKLQA